MNFKILAEIWELHTGKIIGMTFGFIISVLILIFGFFQTLFIILCVTLGYLIGKRFDAKEKLLGFLEKILPPDHYR